MMTNELRQKKISLINGLTITDCSHTVYFLDFFDGPSSESSLYQSSQPAENTFENEVMNNTHVIHVMS